MCKQGDDDLEETQAFEAHRALMRTEVNDRLLLANPFWRAAKDSAFARFLIRFGKDASQ